MIPKEILKKVKRLEITTRGMVNDVFSGEYHSVFKGRGMDFAEVRQYQIGDDIRTIDWNVTARYGHPYVKVFEEERELTVMLLVDASSSGEFGTFERMKGEIGVEIVIEGQTVKTGDYVLGDENGVVFVPREEAYEAAKRALEVAKLEERLRAEIEEGKTLSEVAQLLRWEKQKE